MAYIKNEDLTQEHIDKLVKRLVTEFCYTDLRASHPEYASLIEAPNGEVIGTLTLAHARRSLTQEIVHAKNVDEYMSR